MPLTLRRQRWRRSESNRHLPRCKRGARPVELHPHGVGTRCGRVESNHHSARRQGYSLLSSPMLSVRMVRVAGRARTGASGDHNPGCFRLHHGHHEAGTTGLEPAASRLTSERSARLSYAPEEEGARGGTEGFPHAEATRSPRPSTSPRRRGALRSAGGIRTHGLELMRLARTAAPLPRKSGRQESNLRSPAPEAGGVARSPTAS